MSNHCLCNGDWCECGKTGAEILRCKKPLSPQRMQEILDDMRKSARKVSGGDEEERQ